MKRTKQYITPSIKIHKIECARLLAGSDPTKLNSNFDSNEVDESQKDNKGNIWGL